MRSSSRIIYIQWNIFPLVNKTHISPAIYRLDTKEKRKIIITTDEKKIDVFERFYTRTKKRSLSETTEEETSFNLGVRDNALRSSGQCLAFFKAPV